MKRRLALVLFAGCASGQSANPPDSAVGVPADAKTYLDGKIEPQPDANHVTPPADAAVDAHPDATLPPDACIPQISELLANPVFDLTPMGRDWQASPIDPTLPIITDQSSGFAPSSAPYRAWMGGIVSPSIGGNATDTLYQDVVVPANTTKLELTGVYWVATSETTTTIAYDTGDLALIQTNGTPIADVQAVSNLTTTTAWTSIDHVFAGNLSGQTVRVRMTTSNDFTNETSFYFDTMSLKATHCP